MNCLINFVYPSVQSYIRQKQDPIIKNWSTDTQILSDFDELYGNFDSNDSKF